MRDRNALKAAASELEWFNAIDFGDFQSRGRDSDDAPPNASLYGTFDFLSSIDLKGMRCIDIGAGSGVVALGMKALGADYVAAVDATDFKTVRLAKELTGEDIDYRIIPAEKIREQTSWFNSFDVVVSSGLMYHLLSPFELVYAARKLLKNEGLFVLQTLVHTDRDGLGGVYLNTASGFNRDPSTFFVSVCRCGERHAEERLLRYPRAPAPDIQSVVRRLARKGEGSSGQSVDPVDEPSRDA